MERLTRQQVRDLIRREAATQRRLMAFYGEAIRRAERELADLLAQIKRAQDAGETVDSAWLAREQRYRRWLDLTRYELARFVTQAASEIEQLQAEHAQAGASDAKRLIDAALPAPPGTTAAVSSFFNVTPAGVIRELIGQAADGTPLADLLTDAVGDAQQAAIRELVTGTIRGQNPRVIGRAIHQATDIGLHRATLIARTESIGAYRAHSLQTYRRNAHVVAGWTWMATLDRRTCPACWAMHGSEHDLDEALDSHPGCRCVPVPRSRSWRELGIDLPDTRPSIPSGATLFADLSNADKLAILGRGRLEAYNTGRISLEDLVTATYHPRWGAGRRAATLGEALARA